MATFFSTSADGTGVGYATADTGPNAAPPNSTFRKDFDAATNAAVIAQYQANSALYSFSGQGLNRDGVPVEFAPDGLYFAAKRNAPALLAKAKQVKAGNASFSSEDFADFVGIFLHADGLPST